MQVAIVWIGIAAVTYAFLWVRHVSGLPKRKYEPPEPPEPPPPTAAEIADEYHRQFEEAVWIIETLPLTEEEKAEGREIKRAKLIRKIDELL